jgi:spore coat protein CotH
MYTDDYDYSDIIHLCQTIDGMEYDTPEEFAAALEEVFHVDSFLRYLAVIFTTLNFDQYPDTGNNYYIYSNPGTGKFEWIAWDMNNSWGNFGGGTDYPLFRTGSSIGPLQYAPLYEKIIEVEDYRRDYLAYVDLLIRHRFNEKYIGEQARKFHAMIRPHLEKGNGDQMYFGENAQSSLEEFDSSVEALINLTAERSTYISEIILNSNQITDMDKEE